MIHGKQAHWHEAFASRTTSTAAIEIGQLHERKLWNHTGEEKQESCN